jgi:hypothetical protein
MEKQIKVGPIQRRKSNNQVIGTLIRTRITKMKLGEFFEITGLDRRSATNLRAAVSYYSKKEKVKVSTRLTDSTLIIKRVRNKNQSAICSTIL